MKASLSILPLVLASACGGGNGPAADKGTVPGDLGYWDFGPEITFGNDLAEAESPAIDPGLDEGAADLPPQCPGEFLCACTDNSECYSGFCAEGPSGSMCTRICQSAESCPQGWVCAVVATFPDITYACVYPFPRLCQPCESDSECVPAVGAGKGKYLCVDSGPDGRFCGAECTDASSCPEGYDCVPVTTARGEWKQCRPANGAACPCTEKFVNQGYKTTCYVENAWGRCAAERTCDKPCGAKTPAAETCNQEDDDCDGKVDNQIEPKPCNLVNAYGTCRGWTLCASGQVICQGDYAVPELCNGKDDNCDSATDEGFPDLDGDQLADCVDPDRDGDGVPNVTDNCPDVSNTAQEDADQDAIGDTCDPDDDNDGVPDVTDNCRTVKNSDQADLDGDGVGDACDPDRDGDGVPDAGDNCVATANPDQADLDQDGLGDACDPDRDGDQVTDLVDNCPITPNPDQADNDLDGAGDACDDDDDGDGVLDVDDNCPFLADPDLGDIDGDGIGNPCDCDRDGDGVDNLAPNCPVPPVVDNCPNVPNPGQEDENGNGRGDACETDWDDDGVDNATDNCPLDANPDQSDVDGDGLGDVCDPDADADGLDNGSDNCPLVANPDQVDLDADGLGDACDPDRDGDGDPNGTDCGPDSPGIFHGAIETCNGVDDDCNGTADDEGAQGCQNRFLDEDGDGFGKDIMKCLCVAAGFFTAPVAGDCNDGDPAVFPAAQEVCNNGRDDNCNGSENDEGASGCIVYYRDKDGDGWGTSESRCLCMGIGEYTTRFSGDCDDADPKVNPIQKEVCSDGKDNDCSGTENDEGAINSIPFYYDEDGDGFGTSAVKNFCGPSGNWRASKPGDCVDTDAAVHPGGTEVCNNGKDDDCNGFQDTEGAQGCTVYYPDKDGDGYGAGLESKCQCSASGFYSATKSGDCADQAPAVYPGAPEKCDALDNDCDAKTDEDAAASMCGAVDHATPKCSGDKCSIASCENGWFNVDGDYDSGCECAADGNDWTGNTCDAAVDLGSLADTKASKAVSGRIVPNEDADWYKFRATDVEDSGTIGAPGADAFHVRVRMVSPTNGSIAIRVLKHACSETAACAGDWTDYRWFTNYSDVDGQKGEAPCFTEGQKWNCCAPGECQGGAPAGMSNDCCNNKKQCMRYCKNDEDTFFVKVYRATGTATDCSQTDYQFEVSNGLYPPP